MPGGAARQLRSEFLEFDIDVCRWSTNKRDVFVLGLDELSLKCGMERSLGENVDFLAVVNQGTPIAISF